MDISIKTPDGKPSIMSVEVRNGNAHYFASSITAWRTGDCLLTIMNDVKASDKRMVKSRGMAGTELVAFYVPLPADASYDIDNYAPVVEGAIQLAKINYRDELEKYSKRIKRS